MRPKIQTLHSERLIIRPIKLTDAEAIFILRSNEANWKYFDIEPYKDIQRAEKFITNVLKDMQDEQVYFWVICSETTNVVLGSICLWSFTKDLKRAEVGYEIMESEQKKGYAFEALKIVELFGENTLGLMEIDAITHEKHEASIKLLTKSGFKELDYVKNIMPEAEDGPEMKLYRLALKNS